MSGMFLGVCLAFLVAGQSGDASISIVAPEKLLSVKMQEKNSIDEVSRLVRNVRRGQMLRVTLQPYVNEQELGRRSAICCRVRKVGSYKLDADDIGLPENSIESTGRSLIDTGSFDWTLRSVPDSSQKEDVRGSERLQAAACSVRMSVSAHRVDPEAPARSISGQNGGDDPERNNPWNKKDLPDDYMGENEVDDVEDKKGSYWCCVWFSCRNKHVGSKARRALTISAPIDFQEGKPDDATLVSLEVAQQKRKTPACRDQNDPVLLHLGQKLSNGQRYYLVNKCKRDSCSSVASLKESVNDLTSSFEIEVLRSSEEDSSCDMLSEMGAFPDGKEEAHCSYVWQPLDYSDNTHHSESEASDLDELVIPNTDIFSDVMGEFF